MTKMTTEQLEREINKLAPSDQVKILLGLCEEGRNRIDKLEAQIREIAIALDDHMKIVDDHQQHMEKRINLLRR